MKKKIFLTFTLIIAVFLMVSAVSAEGIFDWFNGDGSNADNNDKTFIVGFSDFPPFGYKDDNNEYIGFDIDLAREVAKRNNWTFKAQPIIEWQTKEVELNSNVIDCIWSEFTIDGRENDYSWSEPYFNNSQVVVVKTDSGINSLDDLKGKIVEVQSTSSALNAIENNKTLKDSIGQINEISDYNTAFMNLQSGVCDAVVVDIGSADYQIKETYSDDTFKILDDVLAYEKYGVAFKKGNDELKNQVQKTLDEMYKDGTVEKIAQNYSDYGIPEGVIYP